MNNIEKTPDNLKKEMIGLRVLFFTMPVMVVAFALISIVVVNSIGPLKKELVPYGQTILMILGVFGLAAILIAYSIYSKGISKMSEQTGNFTERMAAYRAVLIKFLSVCEWVGILSVIAFMFSGAYEVLIVAAVLVFVMLSKWPSQKRVEEVMQLDWKEREALYK